MVNSYTVVDAGEKFIISLMERYPFVEAYVSLFEEFSPSRKYDCIILGHVLEHVENPVEILNLCKTWLNAGGVVCCAVPNAHSLHRQAAVLMGMLEREDSFSEKDFAHGHRRVFNMGSFMQIFKDAGMIIEECGGYWLKPLSDRQINETWSRELVAAYVELGKRYPEIAGEIYVIAKV